MSGRGDEDESFKLKNWSARTFYTIVGTIAGLNVSCTSSYSQPVSQNPRFTLQGPAQQSSSTIIKDGFNKPCLNIEAAARPQTINPKMLNHVVSFLNQCPRLIRVKVCYADTTQCNEVDVKGYKREDVTLGSMMGVTFFNYVVYQK